MVSLGGVGHRELCGGFLGEQGMQTQAYVNKAQMNYSFPALFNSPPPMYPRGPIYIPSIGIEGSSWSVSRHMEGQRSSYL